MVPDDDEDVDVDEGEEDEGGEEAGGEEDPVGPPLEEGVVAAVGGEEPLVADGGVINQEHQDWTRP